MPSIIQRLLGSGTGKPAATNLETMPQQGPTAQLPYSDYGLLPGVAQAANASPSPAPELNPQPYFNRTQLAHANWFTTRVHLSPLGSAFNDQ